MAHLFDEEDQNPYYDEKKQNKRDKESGVALNQPRRRLYDEDKMSRKEEGNRYVFGDVFGNTNLSKNDTRTTDDWYEKRKDKSKFLNEDLMTDREIEVLKNNLVDSFPYPTINRGEIRDKISNNNSYNRWGEDKNENGLDGLLRAFMKDIRKIENNSNRDGIYFGLDSIEIQKLYRWSLFEFTTLYMTPINYYIYRRYRNNTESGDGFNTTTAVNNNKTLSLEEEKIIFQSKLEQSHFSSYDDNNNNNDNSTWIKCKDVIEMIESNFRNTLMRLVLYDKYKNRVIVICFFEWSDARPFTFFMGFIMHKNDFNKIKTPNSTTTTTTTETETETKGNITKLFFTRPNIIQSKLDEGYNMLMRNSRLGYLNYGFMRRD